jgi:hypothetical protein
MISVEKIKTSTDTSGFFKLVVEAQEELLASTGKLLSHSLVLSRERQREKRDSKKQAI